MQQFRYSVIVVGTYGLVESFECLLINADRNCLRSFNPFQTPV